jgi:hypothetical protein
MGIEDRVWVRVNGLERVYAIADEDLERETEEKTSSVHFLRFELDAGMTASLRQGAALSMGVHHPGYQALVDPVPLPVRDSLLNDINMEPTT